MSESKKTSGAFIVLAVILLFLFVFLPLMRLGLGHFFGLHIGRGPIMFPFTEFMHGPAFMFIPLLAIILFWLLISVWVYNDAERLGMSGLLWALLVFFGNIIALIIYLIVRSSTSTGQPIVAARKSCPNCQSPIQADFVVCPKCGTSLKSTCPNCQKNVQKDWKHCPYCGESL